MPEESHEPQQQVFVAPVLTIVQDQYLLGVVVLSGVRVEDIPHHWALQQGKHGGGILRRHHSASDRVGDEQHKRKYSLQFALLCTGIFNTYAINNIFKSTN